MTKRRRPVISVAIATRNYGRYLPRALNSVLRCHNPTDAPVQVVVADDSSTDNTRAVIADFRLRYPENIDPILIRATGGMGAAKNAAIDRCLGRTVCLLDSDDEFLPEKFIHCHAALERGDVDFVTNDFYHQYEEGGRILRNHYTWWNMLVLPSNWSCRNGVIRLSDYCNGAEDLEWMARKGWFLRRRHLSIPLNVQHGHRNSFGFAADSLTPADQMTGRMFRYPHENDRIAPPMSVCPVCGNHYLVPVRCCGRATVLRPVLFYWTVLSPHSRPSCAFSLVILTKNGLPLTRRCVSSILARVPPARRHEVELVFVDGLSTDGTLEYIRELAETYPVRLVVTHPAEPFVYGQACNRGARASVGKYVLLLNNDIELASDDPWTPLRRALDDPRVGVVGCSSAWTPEQRDPPWPRGSVNYRIVNRPLQGYFWGARREVYWELGGVDEAFKGHGYDELDFHYRAMLAHYRLVLVPVRVYHASHATYEPVFGAVRMKQMAEMNRQIFVRKHGQSIYCFGDRVEPYSSFQPAALSVVVAARNQGSSLRETLKLAAAEPRCRDGSVQVVVVDNGSTDETPLLLEEYRLRLPWCLTVITLPEAVAPALARQIGRARAIGQTVWSLPPGEWRSPGR